MYISLYERFIDYIRSCVPHSNDTVDILQSGNDAKLPTRCYRNLNFNLEQIVTMSAPDSPGEDGELYIVLYTIYGKLYDKHRYT